jgi:DNA-binding transcriptional regulator LsrR (DeoR family)
LQRLRHRAQDQPAGADTVGDMMGYDFIDLHGQPAMTPIQGRVIGLNATDLARIPDAIAIAAESSKVTAMFSALRTGTINTRATTASNAMAVLNLDEAMGGSRAG